VLLGSFFIRTSAFGNERFYDGSPMRPESGIAGVKLPAGQVAAAATRRAVTGILLSEAGSGIAGNRPIPFYGGHRGIAWAALGAVGSLLLVIGLLVVNIIQRCRVAGALRESEAKYYDFYENAPDMYYSLDVKTGAILECNETFLKATGYPREEVIGRSVFEFYDGDSATEAKESFQRFPGTGEVRNADRQVKCKDGSVISVSLNVSSVNDKNGNILYSRSIWRDITERRRSEENILGAEKRFRDLLENIQQPAVMLDQDGNITFCNDYLLGLTGWSRNEVLHKSWFDLFLPAEIREDVRSFFVRGISESAFPVHQENPIVTRTGAQRLIVWENALLHDPAGRVVGTASIGIDVTEHRKLEEQLLQSQKMEAIGTLAGGVAHDFNNILTTILGYASLIQMREQESEQQSKLAAKIVKSVERATELTKNLLAFSRKQTVDMKPANVNDIVCGFQTILARLIGEDIELTVRASAKKLVVEADKGQLEQVLMNLTANARDAMPRGGKLSIIAGETEICEAEVGRSSVPPGKYALLTISDSGIGMDKQIQERIFEPFFTTKGVGKGTGLGLSMVYGIIKKHDGFINVYSEPGQGTTFTIYLPLVEAEIEEEPAMEAAGVTGGTETILLAEDDGAVRDMTAMLLRNSGYRVLLAGDGEEALSVFRNHQEEIQLVITDVIMPKRNGRDLYEEIRKIKFGMPVIFMSGYAADIMGSTVSIGDKVRYLSKPLKPAELLRHIREVL
jgi:two-component system, cell cycle sensor histidine kinase and response regulator CckA